MKELTVKVVHIVPVSGQYGQEIKVVIFQDYKNQIYTWRTSTNHSLKIGKTYHIRASWDEEQRLLQRVKVIA